jgi:hypothetical protein
LRVNVPIDDEPPVTVLGFNVSAIKDATDTVSVVVLVVPYTAVIVTDVEDATPLVVIVNVAVVEPSAMVTLRGTCTADVLLLDNVTMAPPAGAAPFRASVPVELFPPTTELGLLVRDDSVAALTVSVVVRVAPYIAVIVTEALAATGVVVMVNVAALEPPEIVTVGGT